MPSRQAGWGDNMAFITTVVNSFGGAWFDKDMRPTINSDEWKAAINFYVDLLGTYGPPVRKATPSTKSLLSTMKARACDRRHDRCVVPEG